MDPESFNHRTEELSTGRTYHFVDQVPKGCNKESTPTLLCIHGFPDLWYGWRYQIGPWVNRGYRVIAPDMLGYGGSSKPEDVAEYTTKKLCADLVALLDLLNIEKAVVIGHDWGSFVASRFALWHPGRLLALVLLSIPYTPPRTGQFVSLERIAQHAPHLAYQLYFANPQSDTEIISQLRKFIGLIFAVNTTDHLSSGLGDKLSKQADKELSTVLTDQEFDYYHSQHSQGMHGPLNYYRTTKLRYNEELGASLGSKLPDDLPVLYIWGTLDAVVTPSLIDKAKHFIKRYEVVALEGRGHWLMVEAKDEITDRIANWLDGLNPHPRSSARL